MGFDSQLLPPFLCGDPDTALKLICFGWDEFSELPLVLLSPSERLGSVQNGELLTKLQKEVKTNVDFLWASPAALYNLTRLTLYVKVVLY